MTEDFACNGQVSAQSFIVSASDRNFLMAPSALDIKNKENSLGNFVQTDVIHLTLFLHVSFFG